MTIKTQKETAATLEDLISQSTHSITKSGDRYTCEYCHNSYSNKDRKNLQKWLLTSCCLLPVTTRPEKVSNKIHIGNLDLHSSHRTSIHKGFIYCTKCGSRAGTCIKHLAKPCVPPGKYGKDALKAILNDRLPPNLDAWPGS